MADNIQINVDDNQNIINIDVVDSGDSIYSLDVSGDKYYMGMAKDWAVKMDGKVAGEDYSAKYYAQKAKGDVENLITNQNFINVSNNIENIITVANDKDNIDTLAENILTLDNLLMYEELE